MASAVGNYKAEIFSIDIHQECSDLKVESPIEQLFYSAFKMVMELNSIDYADFRTTKKGEDIWSGIGVIPQHHIGKFRVDFYVYSHDSGKHAIVECDSQQFHDRTEKERRYEKIRDRFLQKEGHRLFHFTGSEIKENPEKTAAEVLSYLTDQPIEDLIAAAENYG